MIRLTKLVNVKNGTKRMFSSFLENVKVNNSSLTNIESIKFPLSFRGFENIPDKTFSYSLQQILAYSNISEDWLNQHFEKIFLGTLHSFAARDYEFLEEYLETGLFTSVRDSLENMHSLGFEV